MLKIMTWNLENLFKTGHASGPPTQAVYDKKIQGLASIINDQSPDALAVQEVGDPAALDDLVKQLKGGNWHRRVSKHPDVRGIRVAWLTRRVITAPEDILDFPAQIQPVQVDDAGGTLAVMGRGAVAITVQSDSGKPVRLVTVHLKSKLLTFPGGRFQRTTKTSARDSPTMRSTDVRARPPRCGCGSQRRSVALARTAR